MNSSRIRARLRPLPRKGSAILIILTVVTLVTVLVISLLITSRLERTSSSLALGRARAETLADYTADLAIVRLREAIDIGRSRALPGYNLWVSEPGRIHIATISNTGEISQAAREMYSGLPGKDDAKNPELHNVDLNKAGLNGLHPITGNQPGTMKVGWINFLANPGQPASSDNPLVARVAYWVDDESCKVNVNTADGSDKNTPDSFGFGTPSEINLQALPSGIGAGFLTHNQARTIRDSAWANEFNSLPEVGRVPGLPSDFLATNQFNLTTRSRTPELNLFGEPRIYLFPVSELTTGTFSGYIRSCLTGGYGTPSNDASVLLSSSNVDFVYPTSAQLPKMLVLDNNADGKLDNKDLETLYQYAPDYGSGNLKTTSLNYHYAARIARGIKGFTSQNIAFAWPTFPHATPGGFDAKYNDRQLDSIALTISDVVTAGAALVNGGANFASFISSGMLSNQMVIGLGRMPRLTEIELTFDAFKTTPPYLEANPPADPKVPALQVDMHMEFYLPAGFAGAAGYFSDYQIGSEGSHNHHAVNQNDHSGQYADNPTDNNKVTYQTPMGGYWSDKLLRIMDGGNPDELAGIDLRAHARNRPDPETDKSATYHPYANGNGGSSFFTNGNLFNTVLQFFGPVAGTNWTPGEYHGIQTTNQGLTTLYAKRGIDSFTLKGGVSLWGRNGSGAYSWESVPLDSARNSALSGQTPKSIIPLLQDAVIPVPKNFVIPVGSLDNIWHARVADPLVNKFPADWIVTANPPPPNLNDPNSIVSLKYARIPAAIYLNGDNREMRPSGGGDPISIWFPRQDYNYPKQSRFPSIGALNFIRTGVIPDDLTVDLPEQKGIPWRTINLAATTSPGQSITVNSQTATYPDWAMLDLFTVPFTPQRPYVTTNAPDPLPPIRTLTSGGSTEGKLNINNPRIPHPFELNVSNVSQNPPERTAPLDALFSGIRTSLSYSGSNPIYTTISQAQAADLRTAIQKYLEDNGPFLLPGQLAEVPEINAYTYTEVNPQSQSRNDLMREVVGATTTQSNVFSIWVVTQTIQKKRGSLNPGVFEPGDLIVGETRRRYVVERFIETGRDGVPGNALKPAADKDKVIGTADDPVDSNYHPAFPSYPLPYRWRIVSVTNSAA